MRNAHIIQYQRQGEANIPMARNKVNAEVLLSESKEKEGLRILVAPAGTTNAQRRMELIDQTVPKPEY